MSANSESDAVCCPKFDPLPWDGKMIEWKNKSFIRGKVSTFFFMPLNFGKVITKLMDKIEKSGADSPDYLCLSDHTSKWNMDVYLDVDKKVENIENVNISGKFYSKVYEGPFKDTGKWCKDYEQILKSKGMHYKKMYMWYTTCPKCAKKYGRNYTVIISEIT